MAQKPSGKQPAPTQAPDTKTQPAAQKQGAAGKVASKADWERIELEYRVGIKTLRQIAEEHHITHGAINKRARRDGWERDLSAKIQAKADALVSKAAVSTEVSKETRIAEKQIIDHGAAQVAEVKLSHRKDIHRAKRITSTLLDELEAQSNPETVQMLREFGDIMRAPDERGNDKRNDIYQAIIELPERAKTLKTLTESLQKQVDMERQAFGMDAKGADNNPNGPGYVPPSIAVTFVQPPPRPPEDDDE